MADERVRIEIGFEAGNAVSLFVGLKAADELEKALATGSDGAVRVDADDGTYTVALRKVVYLKRFSREGRLGFGDS